MLQGISINKGLRNQERLLNFQFYFFRGNIFTLRELENVLLSINNTENTLDRIELSNISGMNPALGIDSFFHKLWLSIVAFESAMTSIADLSARSQKPSLIDVISSVIHFRNINKLDFNCWVGCTNMPRLRINTLRYGYSTSALCLSIAFHYRNTKRYFKEV